MAEFFDSRLSGYDAHMMTNIESAHEFYNYTARQLPRDHGVHVLDLGCGTGLELEEYYKYEPTAVITGIDLAPGMLGALKSKFPGHEITLYCGSYFDIPFPKNAYGAAVSVESLHHFTKEQKIPLYKKLHKSIKSGGYFILTDFFSSDDDEERSHFDELAKLKAEQGIIDDEFYHYDTPLTVAHETEALLEAGFKNVEILKNWGATYTLKAYK